MFLKINSLKGILMGLAWVALTSISFGQTTTGRANPSQNDHLFPSASVAKAAIDFDSRGFLIHGKRTFIVSAGMEYARVPHELWRDRLLRLKRAGFNAIEMYTFWNFHEPQEGKFDFTGDQDLDAFLKLIHELGMYAIVRAGPYYCGEWELGGYPTWLKFKPNLRVREDNGPFLAAVDAFFGKLIPIVAQNQVHRGGSVILVQLENEHRAGWGTVIANSYFQHLVDKSVALGLQVPYYFSGMHHGNDPARNSGNLDDPNRPNPWFSSEYWSVWYSQYGSKGKEAVLYERRTWKILAYGGNAFNVYMAHGGTNFGYSNDRDMAASYDYGAAIGQTGDLRPVYFTFKRAAWFARSFQEILENSKDASREYKNLVSDTTSVKITARRSPAGTIAFLDNRTSVSKQILLNAPPLALLPSTSLTLASQEIMPVVQDFTLSPGVVLNWAPTHIYGIFSQENTTTLLVDGTPGSETSLYFTAPSTTKIEKGALNFKRSGSDKLAFNGKIPLTGSSDYSFTIGQRRIRILTVSRALADRTWLVESDKKAYVVLGPAFVGEAIPSKGKPAFVAERPWENDTLSFTSIAYSSALTPSPLKSVPFTENKQTVLALKPWQKKLASEPIMTSFEDKTWLKSPVPLQMGADGDLTANAWYRTTVQVPESGAYTLRFRNVRDRAQVFVDGARVDTAKFTSKTVPLQLTAGTPHNLVVFTAHDGRNKLVFYVGPIDTMDVKGISGPVTVQKADGSGPEISVNGWRMRGGPGDFSEEKGWTALDSSTLSKRPQFFRTQFTVTPPSMGSHPEWRVITTGMGHGSVWVNGRNLGRYPEKIKINGLYIPETWLKPGVNSLVIYEEDGVHPNGISIQAETGASRDVFLLK